MSEHTAHTKRELENANVLSNDSGPKKGRFEWRVSFLALLAAIWLLGCTNSLRAQATMPNSMPAKSYMKKGQISLPILIDGRRRAELRELLLFVKTNPQQPWSLAQKASPMQQEFRFHAPADGEYYFTVVTVDRSGRSNLRNLEKMPPQRVLVIDRQPPRVDIRVLPRNAQGQPVKCHLFDANPDPASIQVQYQSGDGNWREMQLAAGAADTWFIPRQAAHTGKIRVLAADRCRNSFTKVLDLSNHGGSLHVAGNSQYYRKENTQPELPLPPQYSPQMPPPYRAKQAPVVQVDHSFPNQSVNSLPPTAKQAVYAPQPKPVTPAPGGNLPAEFTQAAKLPAVPNSGKQPNTTVAQQQGTHQVVNNPQMSVDYQIEKTSQIGVGKVDIWLSQDQGKSWRHLASDADKQSPAEITLPGEGLFGLRLVATNGFGFGGEPPVPGQAPEWFVEVDMNKPIARLLSVAPIKGDRPGTLLINWSAVDKNLGPAPISLDFAVAANGPWTPIVSNLKNHGQHRWEVPSAVRGKVYIRLTAVDRAGNSVQTSSQQPVQVDDFSRPVVRIQGIRQPAGQVYNPGAN